MRKIIILLAILVCLLVAGCCGERHQTSAEKATEKAHAVSEAPKIEEEYYEGRIISNGAIMVNSNPSSNGNTDTTPGVIIKFDSGRVEQVKLANCKPGDLKNYRISQGESVCCRFYYNPDQAVYYYDKWTIVKWRK